MHGVTLERDDIFQTICQTMSFPTREMTDSTEVMSEKKRGMAGMFRCPVGSDVSWRCGFDSYQTISTWQMCCTYCTWPTGHLISVISHMAYLNICCWGGVALGDREEDWVKPCRLLWLEQHFTRGGCVHGCGADLIFSASTSITLWSKHHYHLGRKFEISSERIFQSYQADSPFQ